MKMTGRTKFFVWVQLVASAKKTDCFVTDRFLFDETSLGGFISDSFISTLPQ
jgi:hypothetical protein